MNGASTLNPKWENTKKILDLLGYTKEVFRSERNVGIYTEWGHKDGPAATVPQRIYTVNWELPLEFIADMLQDRGCHYSEYHHFMEPGCPVVDEPEGWWREDKLLARVDNTKTPNPFDWYAASNALIKDLEASE